jgi:hypothetical protein
VADIQDPKDRVATESGFRQTLVQMVGGAALLGGLYFTAGTLWTSQETLRINQKTLETTQQGQITDRFTKAIEQLGDKDRLMVRLGGIYALERIARDSERDHLAVMEVLTAFLRENPVAHQETLIMPMTSQEQERLKPPPDIQAILTVLRRRTRWYGNGETQPLNLQEVQIQNADLTRAHLERANLARAHLEGAKLGEAHLEQAWAINAHLEWANFNTAHLEGAVLALARLERADFTNAHLEGATLRVCLETKPL